MDHFKFIINQDLKNYSITNNEQLKDALDRTYELRLQKYAQVSKKYRPNEKFEFIALFKAIESFTQFINKQNGDEKFDFYRDLLPIIHGWSKPSSIASLALENGCDSDQIYLLKRGKATSLTIPSTYARYILANAFFLNIGSISEEFNQLLFGNLDFYTVYVDSYQNVSTERCICQLSYFYLMSLCPDESERQIKFQRHTLRDTIHWMSLDDKPVNSQLVNVHNGYMENSDASVFVDFANRFIHIGCIIPSMTQEEVLFSCCPELFVCLLCIEEMDDDEVVTVHNVRRFSHYTGYQDTFKWSGVFDESKNNGKLIQDIIIMDAVFENAFGEDSVIRDINKAYLAFKAFPSNTKISTGKWGCGAFGGDVTHKFLQQVCAASVLTNIRLDFSCSNVEQSNALRQLCEKITEKNITIAQLIELLIPSNTRYNFNYFNWITKKLEGDLPST